MQSIVFLALCFGATFAYDPLKTNDELNNAYTSASDFLKHVLDDQHPDLELNEVEGRPILPPDAIKHLMQKLDDTKLNLDEAKKIFTRVNLKQILLNQKITSLALFVPSNDAILKWKKQIKPDDFNNDDMMAELVKAWAVPNNMDHMEWQNGMQLQTLRKDVKLRFNYYLNRDLNDVHSVMTVNGVQWDRIELVGYKCRLYITSDVIYPLPDGTITEELKKAGHFTKFLQLLGEKGQTKLDTLDRLTVFAPTDDAFDKLFDYEVEQILKEGLWGKYVVPMMIYSAGLKQHKPNYLNTMMDSNAIAVTLKNDQWILNLEMYVYDPNDEAGAIAMAPHIIKRDVPATNGVIHVIEKTLYQI